MTFAAGLIIGSIVGALAMWRATRREVRKAQAQDLRSRLSPVVDLEPSEFTAFWGGRA